MTVILCIFCLSLPVCFLANFLNCFIASLSVYLPFVYSRLELVVPDKPKLSELEAPQEDEILCTEVFKNKTYEHVNYPPFVEEDKQDGPGELDPIINSKFLVPSYRLHFCTLGCDIWVVRTFDNYKLWTFVFC